MISIIQSSVPMLRKALGKEAKLCFAGHALMDNRHGLISDVCLTPSVGVTEPEAALSLVARQRRKRLRPKSVGGDKGLSHEAVRRGAARTAYRPNC